MSWVEEKWAENGIQREKSWYVSELCEKGYDLTWVTKVWDGNGYTVPRFMITSFHNVNFQLRLLSTTFLPVDHVGD